MNVLETVRGLLVRRPRPVWERNRHFALGDRVVSRPDEPYPGRLIWRRSDTVGVAYPEPGISGEGELRLIVPRGEIRHALGCEPCQADLTVQQQEDDHRESTYWSQWEPAERQAHQAALEDLVVLPDRTLAFGPNTPVRAWVRTEFDGRMQHSESPSLSLGRVTEPLDWARIVRQHPEFRFYSPWEDSEDSAARPGAVLAAYELLRERGREPWLDVYLDMELEEEHIEVCAVVTTVATELPLDDETYDAVAALMGREANQFPCSTMYWPLRADGPGKDRTVPYRSSSIEQTSWDW